MTLILEWMEHVSQIFLARVRTWIDGVFFSRKKSSIFVAALLFYPGFFFISGLHQGNRFFVDKYAQC